MYDKQNRETKDGRDDREVGCVDQGMEMLPNMYFIES